ncbi:hypothetical protein KC19_3G244400 [Ceratodon purpureus]|uniref:Polymerase nucleotidyl transferase domain-containing protein n=1 Tax=Ceratodon purpureus TaxID=3225 RepID=A0A8T0IQ36_CERPU|nr:hypothetical protein KC19_3G244400 [Ceratodon purpureus]
MDYPENWPQPSGLTAEGATQFLSAFSSAASKDDDWWNRAEDHAAELIASIQPIPSSEKRRQDIVDFVQDLIGKCFNFHVQVETFGSVPLKTYLPDGDIDLTALSVHTDLKETWALDVVKALKAVEEDAGAQFRVKDVQYIQADVKIIKCLVENIVVDISFNQTGGLCTFCFLEQVDRYIGRDHLFKKSIILVKAWCYYESRLLGAHHGLISTYALETLVLYIFHVFHSSLRGPLKVLYTFLVYFSNFDWDKYCVSLWGPVPLKLITERISADFAESPRNDGGSLLLTKEFLDKCIDDYSGGSETNQGRPFGAKFLNVLDPIRDTNNLGRSVNLGSFKRIRSAFGLGARTLGDVLKECSEDQINERFKSFFSCTFKSLERYRSGRPDTGNTVSHGVQHPTSGAGSGNFYERVPSGYKQEQGADTRHSPRTTSYIGETVRPPFHYNYIWPGQSDPGPMDTSELSNETNENMRTRVTSTMTDVPFFNNSRKDSGNSGNTVVSAPDTKQEKFRATEPSFTQPISISLNVTSSEGQWRQAGGKGRYTNVEGDTARAQVKGSNHFTAQENFDRPMPNNRRFTEDHEHANHSAFRSPTVGEYQARASSQDSPRWGSSRVDLVGQGSVSRSRDVSDPSLSLSNHDVGRPPGSLSDSKTSTSHRNSNRKLSSGDENDTSTSGRKSASSEESKTTYGKWVPSQRVYTSPGDTSYQGNSQDSGNQSILQPLPYPKPPFPHFPPLQLPPHIYPNQMHLPVSSAIPVPVSSSSGPPSASSLHSSHHSPSSGESFPSRTNSYVALQVPPILPPALPATSSCMVSVAPAGDGASSHVAGFSPRPEEQWDHWRSPIEDHMQPLHRASVTSSSSPGRSFPMESTSFSEGYRNHFSVAPPVLPQFVLGRIKPAQGSSARPFETAEYPKAYGLIDENLSRLSLSDESSRESSSQLEEGADYVALGTRNREYRQNSLEMKLSDGKHAKGTKGAEQLSRSQSSSDKSDRDVSRNVDGHAAELRHHRISHPSFEETSVRDMQGALLPPFQSPPHSHQEILSPSRPGYHRSSPFYSGTLEPATTVPYQSLQVHTPLASAGTDSTSPSTLDRQVLMPVSVGVPGSMHPPIIEHGPASMGPSFRNRPMETVLMPLTVPQQMYFYGHVYPHVIYIPPATDGIFRGDSVGGPHSNGSMDFGTDTQGSQSLQDARPRTNPQVGTGFAERPKGAGAVISPRNKVETSNVERMSDDAGPGDLQEDILCGSSKTHKENLVKSFQYSCMGFLSPNFATRSPKGPQLWEGSGRQKGNLSLHAGLNIPQPLGGAGPSYASRGRAPEGTQQPRGVAFQGNEDTLPKSRAGTGAYLPSPRQTYPNRGRPGPAGRGGNQHGAFGQQDRNNLEGTNQLHAPRYRTVGQGDYVFRFFNFFNLKKKKTTFGMRSLVAPSSRVGVFLRLFKALSNVTYFGYSVFNG